MPVPDPPSTAALMACGATLVGLAFFALAGMALAIRWAWRRRK